MNPEVKSKWCSALRSGEYEQGKNCLRDDEKFCCLGVLTDIFIKANPKEEWRKNPEHGGYSYDGCVSVLPSKVSQWAGLLCDGFPVPNPHVRVGSGQAGNLAAINDSGLPFSEIADAIERSL